MYILIYDIYSCIHFYWWCTSAQSCLKVIQQYVWTTIKSACSKGTSHCGNSLAVSDKMKHTAIIQPNNCTHGHLSQDKEKHLKACTCMCIAALFMMAPNWKQPRCSSKDEEIEKPWKFSNIKEWTSYIHAWYMQQLGSSPGNYAEWTRKSQEVTHCFPSLNDLHSGNNRSIKIEKRLVTTREGWGGKCGCKRAFEGSLWWRTVLYVTVNVDIDRLHMVPFYMVLVSHWGN